MQKTTVWKVVIVLVYYLIGTFIGNFGFGVIEGILGSAGLLPLSTSTLDWLIFIISVIGGVIGLYYGVKFISKKTTIVKKDRNQSILWFAILELVLIILSYVMPSFQLFPTGLIILIINCLAIFIFFHNKLKVISKA